MAGAYDGRGVTAIFERDPKRPNSPTFTMHYLIPAGDDPIVGDILCVVKAGVPDAPDTIIQDVADDMRFGLVISVDDPPNPRATRMYMALISRETMLRRQMLNNARAASALAKRNRGQANGK